MSNETTIRVTHDGPLATVMLARPERRNAFNPTMIDELRRAFLALGVDDDVRVVVLGGDGPVFSAGADVAYMRSTADFSYDDNYADALRMADVFAAIRDCPKPVVARVHGAAIGGGVGFVAACDIAVAAAGTRFAISEVRLGIIPAVISAHILPRIGIAAARELFLTGETFDAVRAQAIGLVACVVPESALDEAVVERVKALLQAAPGAQAAAKRLIPLVAHQPEAARDNTARMIAERRSSDEGRAGLSAFLERRSPPWAEAAEAYNAADADPDTDSTSG